MINRTVSSWLNIEIQRLLSFNLYVYKYSTFWGMKKLNSFVFVNI